MVIIMGYSITVFVPKDNLGIERKDMPQIDDDVVDGFLQWVRKQGIVIERGMYPASKLKATQKEINVEKVKDMVAGDNYEDLVTKPFIVSRDGYLMDGHHRWAALVTVDPESSAHVFKIGLPIRELLALANMFHGVDHRDITAAIRRIARLLDKGGVCGN